jgi:hypothetical protein
MTHISNYISDKAGDLTELQDIRNDFYRLGDEGFYGFMFQLRLAWKSLSGLIYTTSPGLMLMSVTLDAAIGFICLIPSFGSGIISSM